MDKLTVVKYSLAQAQEIVSRLSPDSGDASRSMDNGLAWYGLTPEDAIKASRYGLDGLYEECDRKARDISLNLNIESIAPIVAYDHNGIEVNLDRYLSNEPECMSTIKQGEGSKVLDILLNQCALYGVSSESLLERGSYIYTVIRALELKGYSVGLSIGKATKASNNPSLTHVIIVRIKNPGEYLDPCLACFYSAHPSSFRRILFRLSEEQPIEIRKAFGFGKKYGNYGQSTNMPSEVIDPGMIVIERIDKDYNSSTYPELISKIKSNFQNVGVSL